MTEELVRTRAMLLDGTPVEREYAASLLAENGTKGMEILEETALNTTLETTVRVTALRYYSPSAQGAEKALRTLLSDSRPVVRCWAIEKVGEKRLTQLVPVLSGLVSDESIVWDLDEQQTIGEVATRVLGLLKAEPDRT